MIPVVYPMIALVVTLTILAVLLLAPYCRVFRHLWFFLLTATCIIYGGGKTHFTYQAGLTDAGSYCTNDLIHAEWTWVQQASSYEFRWQYRDVTITNETGEVIDLWHALPNGMVSDGVAEAVVPDATNMQVICWAEYVPPVYVLTNGVYHLNGVMRAMGNAGTNYWVTPGIRIIDGSRPIAPPEILP